MKIQVDTTVSKSHSKLFKKLMSGDDSMILDTAKNQKTYVFADSITAKDFSKKNIDDINNLLHDLSKINGYKNVEDLLSDSLYFEKHNKAEIKKAFDKKNIEDKKLDEVYADLSQFTADFLVDNYNYFEDMKMNIEENYSSSEMYIFLSDENSQSIFIKDNLFSDDKDELNSDINNYVFDRVEQVENYLEANEAMLMQRINKINLIDSRKNPNINTIRSLAQGKLNHIKEDIGELKTFHSAIVTPLGESHNNVILIDADGTNLYSISKSKIVGTDIDLDDIVKSKRQYEVFNNSNSIEIKDIDNQSLVKKTKEISNRLEIDI